MSERGERWRIAGIPRTAPCTASPLWLFLQFELAEQARQIFRSLERPQLLQNGVGSLCRPALTHVAAEFPLDVGSAHRPLCEARGVVHLAHDAPAVDEGCGETRRHGTSAPRGQRGVLAHLD